MLFLLLALFVAVKGLEHDGLITRLSAAIERGRLVPLKLVVATFFLAMVVTNDVALLVVVPLTLALEVDRKGILVILEALAANAGSALVPIGNPQNLFIYWFYGLSPVEFVVAIAPFSLLFLALLVIASLAVRVRNGEARPASRHGGRSFTLAYAALLLLVILAVLRVVPVAAGALVLAFALLFDRRSLRIDFALLVSFLFFFGLAENLKVLLGPRLEHSGHVFLLSALASQIMSNVPAAVLFAKFTSQWKALLWGSNVGGFGSLVGSLANLIAYKLYVSDQRTEDAVAFTTAFLVLGYAAFLAGIGLYFAL